MAKKYKESDGYKWVKNSNGTYTIWSPYGYAEATAISVHQLKNLFEGDTPAVAGDNAIGGKNGAMSGLTLIDPTNDTNDTNKDPFNKDVTSKDYINSLIEDAYKNYANLNVDPNSAQSQQYMNDMYAAIDREQAEIEAALSNAELDAYRQIGYQQQELENQIAENRLKALKSGTTSAQLAAQQLNNMFAAQAGASQIAANAMNARVGNAQDYASQRAAVTGGLYDQIAQNKTTLATAGAQNAAAGLSYASYVNQQLANLQANKSLYDLDPKGYGKIFNY